MYEEMEAERRSIHREEGSRLTEKFRAVIV